MSTGFSKQIISFTKKKKLKRKTNPSLFNFCSSASWDKGDHLWAEEQRVHPEHHSRGTFLSSTGRDTAQGPQTPLPRPHRSQQGSPLAFGGPGPPPAPLGSSWEQRWAQPARACHEPKDQLVATGAGLAASKQGWGSVPGLACLWAQSKGRAQDSSHGQGRGGTTRSAQRCRLKPAALSNVI